MNSVTLPSLTLLVTNAQHLESGLSAQHTWTSAGGIIGASPAAQWRLVDAQGRVKPVHCEVVMVDGAYCLKDNCGDTYVNGADMPLGLGQMARLGHKDEINIGPYRLRVLFGNAIEVEEQYGSLDALFASAQEDLLADFELDAEPEAVALPPNADPLLALDSIMGAQDSANSLIETPKTESQPSTQSSLVPQDNLVLQNADFTPQADSEYEMTSSIRLKKILGFAKATFSKQTKPEAPSVASTTPISHYNSSESNVSEGFTMDEKVLDLLEEEVAKSIQPQLEKSAYSNLNTTATNHANHLVTGPILDGLGVDLSDEHDMERMHLLSQELGESLQACVRGLLDLHQQVSESRFGTLNRNLQPIEDNPLRLGLSYEETIRTLYDADKSVVHLSAPAAIAESLKTVRDHNEAMQFATSEALSQILNAFSPQVMLRRFHHYKRSSDATQTSTDAWAWNMYCSYYQELTSNRQRGFEKLFWEIFEQAYDRKIREKQLEL
ncbi:type VI secretion system-associated FHA domain protein TagH [Vibrio mimicus]|nr:type VI secretion system-associated FHA domain protein TagH [Vibrio mimicus]QXC56134.1 type VI secretion system-associated FHA domain protein TagH [Vibrio mimicus]